MSIEETLKKLSNERKQIECIIRKSRQKCENIIWEIESINITNQERFDFQKIIEIMQMIRSAEKIVGMDVHGEILGNKKRNTLI